MSPDESRTPIESRRAAFDADWAWLAAELNAEFLGHESRSVVAATVVEDLSSADLPVPFRLLGVDCFVPGGDSWSMSVTATPIHNDRSLALIACPIWEFGLGSPVRAERNHDRLVARHPRTVEEPTGWCLGIVALD